MAITSSPQTKEFVTLVVANLMLIFSSLSRERAALHVLFSSNRTPLLVAVAIGMASILWFELVKLPARLRRSRGKQQEGHANQAPR